MIELLVETALLLISAALAGMGLILLSNWWAFPSLRPKEHHDPAPVVSVLVPARNEVAVIADTIRCLQSQTYHPLEILLLDDDSEDGTGDVARRVADGDPRVKILSGTPLPTGWLGKNWACAQLAAAATGKILIFTDADVRWQPLAVNALVRHMEETAADLLTVWPTQVTESWAERLTVPLMALVVHAYLPVLGVHHTGHPALAAANGQCLAFRRAAYDKIGGHEAVRGNILEDVALARTVKAAGLHLRMAQAGDLVSCRMYDGWSAVRDGFGKNILAGFGNPVGLAASTLFHGLVFLGPWLLLLAGPVGLAIPGGVWWPLMLAAAGILLRGLSAWRSGQRVQDAILLPVSVLMMTRIAVHALWWHWRYGGPRWKGRQAKVA